MKWFKHISDSLDDPFIFDLIDQFGGDGYLVFFGTLEIISREFNTKTPGFCMVPERFLIKKLQLSRQKCVKILKYCHKNKRIFFKEYEGKFMFNCPKLKKLSDTWTTKLLRSDFKDTSNLLRPKEEEVEEEERSRIYTPYEKILENFHFYCKDLPRVRSINGLKPKLKARWKEHPEIEWWEGFFKDDVHSSDFLCGRSSDFRASLDWILGPKNMSKILNGQYQNRQEGPSEADQIRNMR